MDKINLADKLALFAETWTPKIVGELNGQHLKLAKLRGEFVWHRHQEGDELFLVLSGRLKIRLRDREVVLEKGELFVVPRGVEHLPIADEEAHVLLLEAAGTRNTGDRQDARTVEEPEWL